MYVDSAYITKFYVNERDSAAVRKAILAADTVLSSAWVLSEVTCALHRHMREGSLNRVQFRETMNIFLAHVDAGIWTLVPVSERLLRRTATLMLTSPATVYLRAGDAFHLVTAQDLGEGEIWTNDRRLLAAAPFFGLTGRTL